jgi:Holliday junction DNA helicase RuvA
VIGSVRGVLLHRDAAGEVLVEVGGVGYRVVVPTGTLASLGDLGSPVFLHTHLHVREDALTLYGFATAAERRCFEALLGAHGVGPTLALAILSAHSPMSLRRALLTDDAGALTVVPGVGRKTAARLLIELKTRLDVPDFDVDIDGLTSDGSDARAELRAALGGLGYGPAEVRDVLGRLPPEGDVESLLRQALRLLGESPVVSS